MFDKIKQDWEDMPRAHRTPFGGFVALGLFRDSLRMRRSRPSKPADQVAKRNCGRRSLPRRRAST